MAKIHTKNIRDKVSFEWIKEGLRSILLSDVYIESVIRRFESDKSSLMLGSKKLFKSTKSLCIKTKNSFYLSSLLSNKKVHDMNAMGFFAGNIFWAKKSIFLELCEQMRDLRFQNSVQNSGWMDQFGMTLERILVSCHYFAAVPFQLLILVQLLILNSSKILFHPFCL